MMSATTEEPRYMEKLLGELGWNQGTRIPLASPDNQALENLLITRQNEIQLLKEALTAQKQKQNDLNKYKQTVHTEYQENTRLLFANKQQLEQEVKLHQLAYIELDNITRDMNSSKKTSGEINARVERLQTNIARLLKKAESMKSEVCGERGALQEWRAELERGAGDIAAIEQFTKQDVSKAKEMETKRQKLKVEHDRMQDRLHQLVADLKAEEQACDRISVQVVEGMEQRKQMMAMWASAVENLRQRSTDIRHIKEDYTVLEAEAARIVEATREQQAFAGQQRQNNAEARRRNSTLTEKLTRIRLAVVDMVHNNTFLDSEDQSLQRELANVRHSLESLHAENKNILEMQHQKTLAIKDIDEKIRALKSKVTESLDKTKSAERRAKELQDMLNEEERFASQLTVNQQRAMHCSFVEQQKLNGLKNEEKLHNMQLRAAKAALNKMDSKRGAMDKMHQGQKESLYAVCYQLETIGARVSHMEGAQAEREVNAELVEKENRLKGVCARHAARVLLLEKHSARLLDDMRRLARDIENAQTEHAKQVTKLKSMLLEVDGSNAELRGLRALWRRERVEEALLRLKVAHAARAVAGLEDAGFSLDKQRLQLDAAMNERLIEIAARRDIFAVQKRALGEECGALRSDIRERQQRVDQLVKRYDIFIASLGKDESGNEISVTFFKIKFAAERAELRERGAHLDAETTRRERDVAALEATLRVFHAAHHHFVHHVSPLTDDTPEMEEIRQLTARYFATRDSLKATRAAAAEAEVHAQNAAARHAAVTEKNAQLLAMLSDADCELESARERLSRQEAKLQNAKEQVRHYARRGKKLLDDIDQWRIFQMAIWLRDYEESADSALQALSEAVSGAGGPRRQLAALAAAACMPRHLARHQRRLEALIRKIISEAGTDQSDLPDDMADRSVFSTSSSSSSSGMSMASGYTRRLACFRKDLATKVQEHALTDDLPKIARRSTVSLRVVTLGIEENMAPDIRTEARVSKTFK